MLCTTLLYKLLFEPIHTAILESGESLGLFVSSFSFFLPFYAREFVRPFIFASVSHSLFLILALRAYFLLKNRKKKNQIDWRYISSSLSSLPLIRYLSTPFCMPLRRHHHHHNFSFAPILTHCHGHVSMYSRILVDFSSDILNTITRQRRSSNAVATCTNEMLLCDELDQAHRQNDLHCTLSLCACANALLHDREPLRSLNKVCDVRRMAKEEKWNETEWCRFETDTFTFRWRITSSSNACHNILSVCWRVWVRRNFKRTALTEVDLVCPLLCTQTVR